MIMRKFILLCASLFTMVLLFSTDPAQAQLALWVSPTGNDGNNCFEAAPCLTFQGAINKGNVAQINCIGSGYYLPFTITASITIDCGAGNIGVVVAGGQGNNAITINTSSSATIVLRHLALNGLHTANSGIITTGFSDGNLIVEDCAIQGFTQFGLDFAPTSGRGLLQVSNSQIFDNENGIEVFAGSGQIASVTLNRVELVANSNNGLLLEGNVVAGTMRDSIVGGSGTDGVIAVASQVYFTIEGSSIVDNLLNGIVTSSAGAAIKVGASTVGGNGTGVHAGSGSIVSFGDNHIGDNGSDGSFTSTKALQ
jgi:hypothetical protein